MRRSRRERELAGQKRAGTFARGKARRAQRKFAGQHWQLLTFGFLLLSSPSLVAYFTAHDEFVRGLLIGSNVAAAAGYLVFFVIQVTGTASTMMGDDAERFTVDELRPLRRHGWRWVNRMALTTGDIDHVLVGPGGVYAIETKWASEPWQVDPPGDRVRAAVHQVTDSARRLRLWEDFKSAGVVRVEPVVILWGGGIAGTPSDEVVRRVNGVTVVAGPHAATWRKMLGDGVLSAEQVERLWDAMSAHLGKRDPLDEARHPVPTALSTMMWRACATLIAAVSSLVLAAQIVGRFSTEWWVPAGMLMLLGGWWARRWSPARSAAIAWMTAAGSVGVTVVVMFVVHAVR